MERRSRLTYANVVATLALFLAVGGATAFATTQLGKNSVGSKQLKSNAVTTAKIKNGAVTQAKISSAAQAALKGAAGPAGPKGSQGPQGPKGDTGEAGTAKAYGHIDGSTGAVTLGKNLATANVNHIATGGYCISGLSFTPQNPMATVETPSSGIIPAVGIGVGPSACPAGTQVRIFTKSATGTLTDENFFILLN